MFISDQISSVTPSGGALALVRVRVRFLSLFRFRFISSLIWDLFWLTIHHLHDVAYNYKEVLSAPFCIGHNTLMM